MSTALIADADVAHFALVYRLLHRAPHGHGAVEARDAVAADQGTVQDLRSEVNNFE